MKNPPAIRLSAFPAAVLAPLGIATRSKQLSGTKHGVCVIMAAVALLASGVGSAQAPLRCQVRVLNLTANGGINPATSAAWKAGDKYRLVFVTSATTTATSTNISTYNTFVQNAANNSATFPSLVTVSWKAICSTASVNANTNTGTASGTGEAIFLMNGSTAIANNYADLWDGTIAANITRDENNAVRAATSVWSGTVGSGAKDGRPNGALGTGTPATGSFGSALNQWINNGIRLSNTYTYPLFALSEPLTIIDMAPSPDIGASVPAGNLTLSWTNLAPTTGTDVWVDVWFGTNASALTKVADKQLNLTSFLVNLPGSATYFWRIDSYLDGAPTGTPVPSTLFSFRVFDSDLDGFPDDYERQHTNPSSPTALNREDDRDQDGLTNWVEYGQTTNPSDPDSDSDGLLDGNNITVTSADPRYTTWVTDGILFTDNGGDRTFRSELATGTNPLKADTDGDGLVDGVESNTGIFVSTSNTGTNPFKADTDADGLKDGVETNTGTFVSRSNSGTNPNVADTDNDGAGDWYEVAIIDKNPALGALPNSPNSAALKPNIPYPLPDPDASTGVTNKPVKVYIMSGQSNMVGIGYVAGGAGSLDTIAKTERKFPHLVNGSNAYTTRNDVRYRGVVTAIGNGLLTPGQGAKSDQMGPELAFGHVMGYHHDEPVLLLKSSEGNRSLNWDILPPGSPSYPHTDGFTYAGYGQSPERWTTVGGSPSPFVWYAGKQYDDFFLAESDRGGTGWATGISYPSSCYVRHNGVTYISKLAHTSDTATEPGVGAQWSTYWNVYSITNVVDVLDNFAAQYPQWANQGFEIAGFVWWQGHKDQGQPSATRYESGMVRLINSLRSYYDNRYPGKGAATAPFVLGTIGFGGWTLAGDGLAVANAQLAVDGNTKNSDGTFKYPAYTGNVKTIETRSFWRELAESPGTQGFHYNNNAETYMLTGEALGRAMIDLKNVATPGTDFVSWMNSFGVAPGLAGFDQDADGDGIENGAENFFGTNPSIGSAGLVSGTTSTNTFVFTHPQNASPAAGVTGVYRWSKDLLTFRNHGQSDGVTTVNFSTITAAGITTVTATVTGTATSKLFVDVQVLQN